MSERIVRWPDRLPYAVYLVAAGTAVTLLLYGRGLSLPYFSDDFVQIEWLRGLSLVDLWTQVSPYDYYRPLAFSLWVAWRDIGLPLTPAGLRLLNLTGQLVASVLVGLLATQVQAHPRRVTGLLATILFAAYPFAYQAVIWVSAIFYPLVTILMVGAVLAYVEAQRTEDGRRWMVLSCLLAGLAPFAHETGILTGLLILAAYLTLPRDRSKRFWWALAPLLLNILFLILWFTVRAGGVSTLDLSLVGLLGNLTILITGLSYAAMPLANGLAAAGLPLDAGIWLLSIVLISGLALVLRRAWRDLAFAAAWFGLCIGPVLVTMRPDWLIDAPRFLYPAGVGAAVWWSLVVMNIGRYVASRQYRIRSLVLAALFAVIVIPGGVFVYQGVTWHLRGGTALWDVAEAAGAYPDRPLLLVNLPNESQASQILNPRFRSGAILLPPQVPQSTLAGVYAPDRAVDDRALTIGAVRPPLGDWISTYGEPVEIGIATDLIKQGYVAYVAAYDDGVRLIEAGQRQDQPPAGPAIAYFGDFISLRTANWQVENGWLELSLVWEIISAVDGNPTVFVHVVDEDGMIAAQLDGDPVGGLFSFAAVEEWTVLDDRRRVRLAEQPPYTIYVGVWNPNTGERLLARGGDFPDNRVPVGVIGD